MVPPKDEDYGVEETATMAQLLTLTISSSEALLSTQQYPEISHLYFKIWKETN